jgi:hypothetical protein
MRLLQRWKDFFTTVHRFYTTVHLSFYVFPLIILFIIIHIERTYEEYSYILGWIGFIGVFGFVCSLVTVDWSIEQVMSIFWIGLLIHIFARGIRWWYAEGPSFLPVGLVTASFTLLIVSILYTVDHLFHDLQPISKGQSRVYLPSSFLIFTAFIAIIVLSLTRIRSNPREYYTIFGWIPIIACYGVYVSIWNRIKIISIIAIPRAAILFAEGLQASNGENNFLIGFNKVISSLLILISVFWFPL